MNQAVSLKELLNEVSSIRDKYSLSQEQADLVLRDKLGSKLWWECCNKEASLQTCKSIFYNDKNTFKPNINNISCSLIACSSDNITILKWLYSLSNEDLYIRDRYNDNVLSKCILEKKIDILNWIITEVGESDFSDNYSERNVYNNGIITKTENMTEYLLKNDLDTIMIPTFNIDSYSVIKIIKLFLLNNIKTTKLFDNIKNYFIYDIFNYVKNDNPKHIMLINYLKEWANYKILENYSNEKKISTLLTNYTLELNKVCCNTSFRTKRLYEKQNKYQKIIEIDLIRQNISNYLFDLLSDDKIYNLKIFLNNIKNSNFSE